MYSLPVLHRLSLSYSLSPKRQLCKIYSIKAESGLQVFHNLPQILFVDQPRTRAVQTQRHDLKTQIIRKHRIVIAHEKAVVRFPRLLHGFGLIPPKRHESCPQAPSTTSAITSLCAGIAMSSVIRGRLRSPWWGTMGSRSRGLRMSRWACRRLGTFANKLPSIPTCWC